MCMQEIDTFYDMQKVLEKRSIVILMARSECRVEAVKAKKAGDVRTALKWMYRMKVLETDLDQTEGEMLVRLEQRMRMLKGLNRVSSVSDEGVK